MRVAMMELQPCAMLAKGPPCTNAGVPSSVCTRFGLRASFSSAGHGALRLEVAGRDGLVVARVAHDDAGQALFEVGDGGGQAEDGHDLAGHRDVEAVLARHAMSLAAHTVHHVAQLAIVHVHHALPRDLAHVDAQLVSVVDVRVKQGRQRLLAAPMRGSRP